MATINPKTKIGGLLDHYPYLIDYLVGVSKSYGKLKNRVFRKGLGKIATLEMAAGLGGIPVDDLIKGIEQEIARREGREPGVVRVDRVETLKSIIRQLHKGEAVTSAKRKFRELLGEVEASEISLMEEQLMAEGMPQEEIKRLCDVHVEVFKESLEQKEPPSVPEGHPVHTYMKENKMALDLMDRIEGEIGRSRMRQDQRAELSDRLEVLSQIDVHYTRKENQLFPVLEDKGVTGPSQVMWAIHDEVRGLLKSIRERLQREEAGTIRGQLKELFTAIREMIYKEEHILFPMALEQLSETEWLRVRRGEQEIGWAWVEPGRGWKAEEAGAGVVGQSAGMEAVSSDSGALSADMVALTLNRLPLELTIVDSEDRVTYYSQPEERIFPRSPGIIGRKVQNCHPPKSLAAVQSLLDDFRKGNRDSAEFWIQRNGRFIHILYMALRDGKGGYRGTVEMSQDVTEIRGLEGEKRLLD
jgi:DUF438 domain-containing protein